MTVVVACRFLKTAAIFADCRVSDIKRTTKSVDDNLQKIYQIDERMILGFSGPLAGAYQVIEAIRTNLRAYSKRPVAVNLQRDIERWIKHEYREIKKPEDREGLSFILTSVEPSREARSKWRSSEGKDIPKPEWFGPDPPEIQMIKLRPLQPKSNELVTERKGMCQIIGVKEEIQELIWEKIQQLFGFVFEQPEVQAQVITQVLMVTLMGKQVQEVGGLFQSAILSANGIQWLSYSTGDIALNIVNGQYIQQDNVTGRTVPLKPIWEWWQEWQAKKNPKLGNVGIFEDPDLRKATKVDVPSKDEGV